MKRIAAVLAAFAALPLAAQVPFVDCWREDAAAQVTIVFGYTSAAASPVSVPVGAANLVTPLPFNGTQPTSFLPGTIAAAFNVTVPLGEESSVSWTLNGVTAGVNLATQTECSMCLCPAGPAGVAGATGAQGPEGPQGAAGAIGARGIVGIDGPPGESGATGPIGATGPAGAIGPQGAAGAPGSAGTTGPAGAAGPKGPAGSTGPSGPAGLPGVTGPAGARGPDGPPGAAGPAGQPGPAGAAGPPGAAGPRGLDGSTGLPGEKGEAGPDGEPAVLEVHTFNDAWSAEIDLDEEALIVVMGTLSTASPARVGVEIAGRRVATTNGSAVRVPEAVVASAVAPRGRHRVRLVVPEGVSVTSSSLTIVAFAHDGEGRRRAVRR